MKNGAMLPFNLTYIALGHGHALLDPIAWVQHDLIFYGKAGLGLCHPTVTLPEPDDGSARAPILDREDSPVLALSKESRDRHHQHVLRTPDRDMHDHAVIVTERRPCFGRIDEIDDRADPLFLDTKCGDLDEPRRIYPCHPATDG